MIRRWCAAAAVLLTLTGQAWVGQTLRNLTQILSCSCLFFLLHVIPFWIPPPMAFFFGRQWAQKKRGIWLYIPVYTYLYIYIHITKSWRSSWNHHVRLTKDHLTGPFDWRAGQVRRPANQVCVFLRDHRSTFLVEGLDCKPLIQI